MFAAQEAASFLSSVDFGISSAMSLKLPLPQMYPLRRKRIVNSILLNDKE